VRKFKPLYLFSIVSYLSLALFCGSSFANIEKRVSFNDIPLIDGAFLVKIEVDELAQLNFSQVNRYLLTSSDIASVESQTEKFLILKANKIGSTFLHVWDRGERKTIKILVKRKKLPESTVAKREEDLQKKKDTFKIGLEYEFVTTNTGPEFNDIKNDFMRHDYRITLNGETPFGFVGGFVRFQDFGGTHFSDAFTDGTLRIGNVSAVTRIGPYSSTGPSLLEIGPHAPIGPLHDFTLVLGDNFYNVTPFTAPWSLARGAFFSQSILNERVDYLVLWANDQEPFRFLEAQGQIDTPDHYYSGADVTWHINDWLDLGGTFFFSYGEREESTSDHVAAGNFFADLEWLTVDGELAQTEEEIAWRIGTDLYSPKNSYHVGAVYRDIEKDFFAINGQTLDRGEKGVLARADADPLDFVHLEATVDRYKDRLFPSESDPDGYNTDFLVRGRVNLPWRMYFTSTYRDADLTGSLVSRKESSYSFQLNKTFTRVRGLGLFARYKNKTVDNFRSSLLSYDRESLKLGARWQVLKGLSMGVTQEWANVKSRVEPVTLTVPPFDFFRTPIFVPIKSFLVDKRTSPRRFTADIYYYTQILKTPFYIDLRLRYEDEDDTDSINSFFAGEDTLQGEVELSYIPSDYFKAYARGRLEDRKSEISGERDLVEAELVVGAYVLFDTGLKWDPQGTIRGMVFKDINGNGLLDDGEMGVSGIEIFVSESSKRVQTKEDGVFDLGKVQGKVFKVTIDLQSVPAGYINTTPFSQNISIRQGKVSEVYFGIIARSGVRGIVFNDVNGNGFLDGEDKGMSKVVVKLDQEKKMLTDREGRYYFENVSPGDHVVSLDLESLPLNYIPQGSIKQKITVAEGRTHTRYFPVRATRQLSGKVFLDQNKNGKLDPGEKGLERMMVAIGPTLLLTDEEGKFTFKNLPAGRHIVELRPKGIPEGHSLATPGTRIIDLGEENSEISGIYFGLKN